jgi:hypothetical protein
MSNPKLALIPSGYNDSIVYSILPSDGSGDFIFDRGDSATRVNKDGLIETVSEDYCRLDWLNSDCPSLLLESQKTNTQTYSESSTGKSLTGATLTNDKATSPTGEYNAMELKEDTSTGKHRFFTGNVTVVDGTIYTLSFFVKKNSDNRFIFINAGGLIGVSGSFDLDTQAVTGGVQLFETYPNGWYRIGITEESSSDVTNGYFIQLQQGTTDASYTGDESSVFVWGLQFEEGNLSSYIPNLATGSTTRSAEACTDAGDVNVFNSLEGVLYAQMAANSDDGTYRYISINDGTDQNVVAIRFSNISNQILVFTRIGGTFTAVLSTTSYTTTNFNKIAYRYKSGDFALFINATKINSSTSTQTLPVNTLNTLSFDNAPFSPMNGKVKDVRYYDTALTDAELTELTT